MSLSSGPQNLLPASIDTENPSTHNQDQVADPRTRSAEAREDQTPRWLRREGHTPYGVGWRDPEFGAHKPARTKAGPTPKRRSRQRGSGYADAPDRKQGTGTRARKATPCYSHSPSSSASSPASQPASQAAHSSPPTSSTNHAEHADNPTPSENPEQP